MSFDEDDFDPWDVPSEEFDSGGNTRGDDREEVFGAQHTLILIDCRPSMFVPSIPFEEVQISPIQAALEVSEKLLRTKVKNVTVQKTGKRDGVGIMLYGVPSTQTTTASLVDLEQPGIASIKQIQTYLEHTQSLEEEYKLHDRSKESSWTFRKALQEASSAFAKAKCVKDRTPSSKQLPDGKSLWIFTNDDDPLQDEDQADGREKVEKAASDVLENGIDIQLWPLKTPFQSEFYDSILSAPVETQQDLFDYEELMERIKREFRKQRVSFSCPLLIPGDYVGIALDFYRPVQVQRKPTPTTIHQETKKHTVRVSNMLDVMTGEILHSTRDTVDEATKRQSNRIRTVTDFAGTMVPLAKAEVEEMKKLSHGNQERASLILRGFKAKDSLPSHFSIDIPYYLYPNDSKVKGSATAFANLHASMIRKGVYAVGELLTKVSATSRLVAIFPQEEKYQFDDADADLETPYCMVAHVLPFEDEMRTLEPDSGEATDTSVQAAMELIGAMHFNSEDFSLDLFRNDSLAQFYNYMESIALETTLPPPEHSFEISDDVVRKNAGKQIDAFLESLPEDIVVKKEAKKRKREPDESGCDWISLYANNELDNCKIPQLKSYLKSTGEIIGGNKAALVERVKDSIEARLKSGEVKSV